MNLEIDIFFKPQLNCTPLMILLFHSIVLLVYVAATHKKQKNSPRRGITFEESFSRNRKKRGGARTDFAIHPRYLFPNDHTTGIPRMIAIGRGTNPTFDSISHVEVLDR